MLEHSREACSQALRVLMRNAQNLFLEVLASDHSSEVMEADDTLNGGTDVAHGSVGEVWPTSPPTIQRDDQCRAEQLARDEALARQLQEDEGALYHATGDRPNGQRLTHWTAPPEGPKNATPSERPMSVPQHGRGNQKRSMWLHPFPEPHQLRVLQELHRLHGNC
eukprot:Em0015g655a